VGQANTFYHSSMKLISAVDACLAAVTKFDEDRNLMAKDYEQFARQQAQLKENLRIMKAENNVLKRKLAFEQKKKW